MKVLVLGYGKSGKGAVKLLIKNGFNVDIYTDSNLNQTDLDYEYNNIEKLRNKYKKIVSVNFIDKVIGLYDFAVVSPGFTIDNPIIQLLKNKNIEVVSEIELGYYYTRNIIAITGTNGKSTTTKLIENMCRRAGLDAIACGNFGNSFCESICDNPNKLFIVEVSCFQLETIKNFKPKALVITNISKDHLDRYSDFKEYKKTKKLILKNITDEIVVANYDDKNVMEIFQDFNGKIRYFSRKNIINGVYIENDIVCYKNKNKDISLLNTKDLYIDYPFEIENCLAIIALGLSIKLPIVDIIETVKYFDGLKYRLEYVREYKGKKYYNNSKCTNVASCIASINSIKEDCLLILGGSSKNECFEELFDNLPSNVKKIAICGDNAKSIIDKSNMYNSICKIYPNLESILENTKDLTNIKVVLYSPSSASFDKYTSSTERGEIFCKLAWNLK